MSARGTPPWRIYQERRDRERLDRERQDPQRDRERQERHDRERQHLERRDRERRDREHRDREPRAPREPDGRARRIQEEADREARSIQEEEALEVRNAQLLREVAERRMRREREETVRLANVAIALAAEFPLPEVVHPEQAAHAEEAQVLARERAKEAIREEQRDLDRRLKLLSGNLKKYSGSTDRLVIDDWRDNHRRYLVTLGYDAITKGAAALTHLESFLEGSARNWFREVTPQPIDMATFFVALATRFYPRNLKQLALVKLKRLRVRTDDKIGEYVSAFEKVLSEANSEGVAADDRIRPEESIPIFQSGFKLSEATSAGYLFHKLVEKRVDNPGGTLHDQILLVNTLIAAHMIADLANPQIAIPKKRYAQAAEAAEVDSREKRPRKHARTGAAPAKRVRSTDEERAYQERLCYNCLRPGHLAFRCPEPKVDKGLRVAALTMALADANNEDSDGCSADSNKEGPEGSKEPMDWQEQDFQDVQAHTDDILPLPPEPAGLTDMRDVVRLANIHTDWRPTTRSMLTGPIARGSLTRQPAPKAAEMRVIVSTVTTETLTPDICNPMVVHGRIVGRFARILVDTGCNSNMISESFAARHRLELRPLARPIAIGWAHEGGRAEATKAYRGTVTLWTDRNKRTGIEIRTTFVVAPIHTDIILGMPTCGKRKWSFNIDTDRPFLIDGEHKIHARRTSRSSGIDSSCATAHLRGIKVNMAEARLANQRLARANVDADDRQRALDTEFDPHLLTTRRFLKQLKRKELTEAFVLTVFPTDAEGRDISTTDVAKLRVCFAEVGAAAPPPQPGDAASKPGAESGEPWDDPALDSRMRNMLRRFRDTLFNPLAVATSKSPTASPPTCRGTRVPSSARSIGAAGSFRGGTPPRRRHRPVREVRQLGGTDIP
ncbi:hypothetical protein HKX48_001770 [Thoreauomyces humboldtii]|nr:hypothetical protein HKX48_001770 [Thoreauomyces humboldtii]